MGNKVFHYPMSALHLAVLFSVAVPLGLGLLLDRLFGEPRHHHPLVGFGRYATAIERLFRRLGSNRGVGLLAWSAAVLPCCEGCDAVPTTRSTTPLPYSW